MRRSLTASACLAVLAAIAFTPGTGGAQTPLPTPSQGFKPPPAAPVKPYKAVAVKPPAPFNDASFVAFRKQLSEIAQRKDRAALAKLVVAKNFFIVQDKDVADKSKSGIDNLAHAIGLDDANGAGWDILANEAEDPTAVESAQQKGIYCAPAPPGFDVQAADTLLDQTQTDPSEWGYPVENGTEVRSAAQPNAAVVEKLGLYLVRVLTDSSSSDASGSFLHVALPDGKTGYVPIDAIAPLAGDQICYGKDAGGWKIAGYIGGISP